MGIHPKSIYKKNCEDKNVKFYNKKTDHEILPLIKKVIEQRPTYGYKRVTSMVNKHHRNNDEKINKKRIYRIMKKNGLILPKTQKIRDHVKTGKIVTLHSNTRWCSDCFEIKCFNGEKVYVAFVLDACDREVISFIGKKTPILSEDMEFPKN